jgi:hypothetical protein
VALKYHLLTLKVVETVSPAVVTANAMVMKMQIPALKIVVMTALKVMMNAVYVVVMTAPVRIVRVCQMAMQN